VCLSVRASGAREEMLSWNAWKDRLLRCRNTVRSGETDRQTGRQESGTRANSVIQNG
jgi:hypothetical protein